MTHTRSADAPSLANRISATAVRVAGLSLIAASVGFMMVFTYLAQRFNYPDVLDGSASEVLPKLLALGAPGRAVWFIYALIPLLLIPAVVGIDAALRAYAPNAMRLLVLSGVVAAISMLIGLARWPTIQWAIATTYLQSSESSRVALEAMFSGLNLYLGNFIGEFLGEIALNTVFVLAGYALVKANRLVVGSIGVVAGGMGFVAAFRNVTDDVALIADVNNIVLPLWLIMLGAVLLRWSNRRDADSGAMRSQEAR